MTVRITNASMMPFIVSLYHDSYCAVSGRCECKRVAAKAPIPGAGGAVVFQHRTRLVPRTLHVEPGATVSGLPEAVLKVPQVARARKGSPPRISVVVDPNVAPPPQQPKVDSDAAAAADVIKNTPDSDAKASGESRSRRRQSSSSQARS